MLGLPRFHNNHDRYNDFFNVIVYIVVARKKKYRSKRRTQRNDLFTVKTAVFKKLFKMCCLNFTQYWYLVLYTHLRSRNSGFYVFYVKATSLFVKTDWVCHIWYNI